MTVDRIVLLALIISGALIIISIVCCAGYLANEKNKRRSEQLEREFKLRMEKGVSISKSPTGGKSKNESVDFDIQFTDVDLQKRVSKTAGNNDGNDHHNEEANINNKNDQKQRSPSQSDLYGKGSKFTEGETMQQESEGERETSGKNGDDDDAGYAGTTTD